jgi:hypothetical protein
MPGESFPIGHRDFRPLLQRDGLILLSWALWEDWGGGGNLLQRYIVTWVASKGRNMRYATRAIPGKELERANPERRADALFYKGRFGDYFTANHDHIPDRIVADYLYLAAPFDLNGKTIPGFIRILKALGSTVNFDITYSLTKERAKRSEALNYLEKFPSTEVSRSL